MKPPPNNKYEKMIKEQQHQFKLDILEQFCNSVQMALVDPDEEGVLSESVKGRNLQYKKLELNKQFGVMILHFVDQNDVQQTFRLALELKRA